MEKVALESPQRRVWVLKQEQDLKSVLFKSVVLKWGSALTRPDTVESKVDLTLGIKSSLVLFNVLTLVLVQN